MRLLFLSSVLWWGVDGQNNVVDFTRPADCAEGDFFDFSHLQCVPCPDTTMPTPDKLACACLPGYRKTADYGGFGLTCSACEPGSDGGKRWPTPDGWDCRPCPVQGSTDTPPKLVTEGTSCPACAQKDAFKSVRNTYGTLEVAQKCERCLGPTMPASSGQRCVRCNEYIHGRDCQCKTSLTDPVTRVYGGVCFDKSMTKLEPVPDAATLYQLKYDGGALDSWYFHEHIQAAVALCKKFNLTACQVVGNLCVLSHYAGRLEAAPSPCREYNLLGSDSGRSSQTEWPQWQPWLYYIYSERLDESEDIPTKFNFDPASGTSELHIWAARYLLNGTYVGLSPVIGGSLQLCQNEQWIMDAAFTFGRRYHQSCEIPVRNLWDRYKLEFLDLYLEIGEGDERQLYPIPVLNRNLNPNRESRKVTYVRRLFLVDNVAGKEWTSGPNSRAQVVRYLHKLTLHINIQATKLGNIFPPYVEVEYGEVRGEEYEDNKKVRTEFLVDYRMETTRHEKDLEITLGTLCSIGALWTLLRTIAWSRRAGKGVVDFATVAKFLLILSGTLADIFFIVMMATTLWILVAYKNQLTVVYMVLSREQEYSFTVYVGVAAVLKLVEMLHLILEQVRCREPGRRGEGGLEVTTETFFIDWERPRGQVIPSYRVTAGEGGDAAGVERGEGQVEEDFAPAPYSTSSRPQGRLTEHIQDWGEPTTRGDDRKPGKTSYTLQLFFMVFLLKVLHLENIALVEPDITFGYVPREFQDSRMNRFGLAAGLYLFIGLGQWFVNVFIVERCVVNHFGSFVDLCSIANISVLCLTRPQYGFYIHGRSVHGHADTNMREMNEMLQRERDNLCSKRGLENNDDVQCFTVVLPPAFREAFEDVVAPLRHKNPAASRLSGQDLVTVETETVIGVYGRVNAFLCSFLEKRGEWSFSIRDRTALEAILDIDFGDTAYNGEFLRDPSEAGFSAAFLYGQEWVQLSFDALCFCVFDLITQDFVLAAFITFLIVPLSPAGGGEGGEWIGGDVPA